MFFEDHRFSLTLPISPLPAFDVPVSREDRPQRRPNEEVVTIVVAMIGGVVGQSNGEARSKHMVA